MLDIGVDEMIGVATAAQMSGIPAGLDEMEPGPFLAIVLSGIDLAALSGTDRVTVLRARQRMASHYAAETFEAMASIVDSYQDEEQSGLADAAEGAAYELRAALHLTRRAADTELAFALDLRDRLPKVFAAFATGMIDQRRARTIVWQIAHLDDGTARAVVDRIIDQASELTTGQLIARIRKLAIGVDPEAATRRYEQALAERRVVIEPSDDGTVNLYGMDLPPDRALAARRHIDRIAQSLRRDGETRAMDQLRADTYLDLLCGTSSNSTAGTVDLRVGLETLIGLSNTPGELAGYGPVIDDITRRVIADNTDGQWRFTVTHQGYPVATGTTRRRPTTNQRRLIESTRATCSFPGCRTPADECDLDHTTEWAQGGPTKVENLTPLCRHDHTGRHQHGWTYRTLPNGDIEWSSPLGHTYITGNRDP